MRANIRPNRAVLLLVGISLAQLACYSYYPQRFRYRHLPPGLRIIRASAAQVNEHCRTPGGKMDNGAPITSDTVIRCCYEPKRNIMIVTRGMDDCIEHELCHFEGKTEAECDNLHSDTR